MSPRKTNRTYISMKNKKNPFQWNVFGNCLGLLSSGVMPVKNNILITPFLWKLFRVLGTIDPLRKERKVALTRII